MSIITTAIIHCDDCLEPIDDGEHGHRSRSEARRIARKYGCKRRKMADGKWYDICIDCDNDRASLPKYNRHEPRRGH